MALTAREQLLIRAMSDRLRHLAEPLLDEGWLPALVVFGPDEIERIPGFKVALIVPIVTASA